MKNTRIGLVQMESEIGHNQKNLINMEAFICEAAEKKVDLLCFPEMSISGYSHHPEDLTLESITGDSVIRLSELAQKSGMVILAGLAEKAEIEKPFISQIIVFPNGSIQVYRKTHLGKNESKCYSSGNLLTAFEVEKARFGVGICWDMHFPEVSTVLSLKGSEIIFTPHASPQIVGNRRDIWMKYLPARAYDNAVFVAACNLVGSGGQEKQFCGGALVLDPQGNVVAEDFSGQEGLLIADLDSLKINQIRQGEGKGMKNSFFLESRRPELYHEI